MDIAELLALAVENKASDLHLSAGLPPMIRIDGDMQRVDLPILNSTTISKIISTAMNERQREVCQQKLEVDFSFELPNLSRFRVNAFNQWRGAAATFRVIPSKIHALADLNAPPILQEICMRPHGLVLVTGPTGCGKSTTIAAMVERINNKRQGHIIAIEDPIEFVHHSKRCLINQREVGEHTHNFASALRSALREDPDVILVGELRDLETIRLALTAAETGHLVLATLHTTSAAKTINRVVDVFPAAEKAMVRSMLSESIQAVISQTLLKRIGGGRIAAHEIMLATPAIRNLIRQDKTAQLYSMLQTGQAEGMVTLDQSLEKMLNQRLISNEDAFYHARDKGKFR